MLTRRWAICSALLAMGVGLIMGLRADNPTEAILTRSLVAMAIFYLLGGIAGTVADIVLAEREREIEQEAGAESAGETEASAARSESAQAAPGQPDRNGSYTLVDEDGTDHTDSDRLSPPAGATPTAGPTPDAAGT